MICYQKVPDVPVIMYLDVCTFFATLLICRDLCPPVVLKLADHGPSVAWCTFIMISGPGVLPSQGPRKKGSAVPVFNIKQSFTR